MVGETIKNGRILKRRSGAQTNYDFMVKNCLIGSKSCKTRPRFGNEHDRNESNDLVKRDILTYL